MVNLAHVFASWHSLNVPPFALSTRISGKTSCLQRYYDGIRLPLISTDIEFNSTACCPPLHLPIPPQQETKIRDVLLCQSVVKRLVADSSLSERRCTTATCHCRLQERRSRDIPRYLCLQYEHATLLDLGQVLLMLAMTHATQTYILYISLRL